MTIAQNIKQLREIFGVTQDELARVAGVTENAVSKWENGYANPRMGAIERIAACYHISKSNIIEDGGMDGIDPITKLPRYLPKGAIIPAPSEYATAPLYGWVHAGEPTEERVEVDLVELPKRIADAFPDAFFLRVEGDCMNRSYPEGCYVLVDPARNPWNGCAVAVELEGYDALLRRYHKGSNTLMLSADSFTDYDDIIIQGDIEVKLIGVVV